MGLERLCRGCIGLAHEQDFGGAFSCTVGDVFYLQQLSLGVEFLLGLNLHIGVADEEVFVAAKDPCQLIMRDDQPGFRRYYLHQYWASSVLADHADGYLEHSIREVEI